MYWDDRYGTETVSHEVLGRMKQLMVDNNTAASHSFLLDDDSSIPFSLDDISNLMEDKVSQGTHRLCTEAYLRLLLACLLSEAVYALLFRRLCVQQLQDLLMLVCTVNVMIRTTCLSNTMSGDAAGHVLRDSCAKESQR